MNSNFNLEKYLSENIKILLKDMMSFSNFHPREGMFLAQYVTASKKAIDLRKLSEKKGEHIPPFIIASITSVCNLHCAGCYARSLESCTDGEPVKQLTANEWSNVFSQARDIGISFILIAGGEPMTRKDVIEQATKFQQILFPIFTNGTMISEDYIEIFDKNRNLVPMLSIEGGKDKTDTRRGNGIYQKIVTTMNKLSKKKIIFGTSITVTSENIEEVTSDKFIDTLYKSGCKVIIYVEFVPIHHNLKTLSLSDTKREYLSKRVNILRKNKNSLIIISFPGDEKSFGGCLSAGRGFFHINSQGEVEPCPFSPYSDMNIRDNSLKDVINSKLFKNLRESNILSEKHDGGCVLFEKREQVEQILKSL